MLIKKGKVILNVTKGAFNALFKAGGWAMADDASDETELHNGTVFMSAGVAAEEPVGAHEGVLSSVQQDQTEQQEDEDYEIPFSEMKMDELINYAAERNIELGSITKKADIIAVIKAATEKK